jgi:hypothetical protein
MTFIVDGSLGGTFPTWTTATRPVSPAIGQMGYNTTTGQFDAYTSNGWTSVATSATAPTSGPAFFAYLGTNQSVTAGTGTKILFDTEDFDTNNNFASSTFTPTVAGYYQFNVSLDTTYASGTVTRLILQIYKSGVNYMIPFDVAANVVRASCSFLLYMNGSTDNVEIYGWIFGVTSPAFASGRSTSFSGSLVRPA